MAPWSVLLVASCPPPVGGQSVATTLLLRALERRAVEHRVVDLSREDWSPRRAIAALQQAGRLARLPAAAARAARRLRARPRLFYLQLGHGVATMARDLPLLAVARALGMPTVLHLHGGAFRAAFDAAPAPLRAAMARALRGVDRVIVLSPALAPIFDGLVPPERLRVVPNGVEDALVRAAAASPPGEGPEGGPLRVLFLSNLLPSKGYVELLEAADRLRARGVALEVRLAGARLESTRVDPAAVITERGLDNVSWVGPVDGEAKVELLRWAQAFALPSHDEGQPIAILEAMVFGLPVVSTRVGGIPDLVADGTHGLLVPAGDVEALADALARLADDPALRRRLSAAGRAEALARYTEDAHGRAMLAVLGELAAERSPDGTGGGRARPRAGGRP